MRRLCSMMWLLLALPGVTLSTAHAQVICVSNVNPPPELPVYAQPPIPAPGYIWTPGYWAGGPNGYFWVPGTWVQPPTVGLLWTPGYWGWSNGIYTWNAGYWGPHVGFYGGVNYGFGYGGAGYEGGRWENGVFAYNRTVNNFGGVRITNVFEKTVIVNSVRVSFNGGSGGIVARPTPEEESAAHEQHVAAIPAQFEHERGASADKSLLASENHGMPPIAATSKPGDFTGKGVVAARELPPNASPASRLNGGPAMEENAHKPPLQEERAGKTEGPIGAPAKPLATESKLPNNAAKLGNPEAKPLNTEAKPVNPEGKPLNTAAKPPEPGNKMPGNERNIGAHPEVAAPHRAPPPPPPHVANAPKPPAAHPAPHPTPGGKDKEKKPQ